MSPSLPALDSEWLETDGLGGFASGTVGGPRTRRYHALLLTAHQPPVDRLVLVPGFDAWVTTPGGTFAISSQHYRPGVIHPDGASRLVEFRLDPWPRWTFALPDGTRLAQELFIPHGHSAVVVRWRVLEGPGPVVLRVRPFLSGRDYHALHHENAAFDFSARSDGDTVTWRTYPDLPAVISRSNGSYRHEPRWYRQFEYREERERGLDYLEDLASPGEFTWDLSTSEGLWLLSAEATPAAVDQESLERLIAHWSHREERRRAAFPTPLHRAADQYLVRRQRAGQDTPTQQTLIAGYPWFTDWGRDTFLALRGLCLSTGRLADARDILLAWADALSEGMLPNRFPDRGEAPEYNSVDAALWFVVGAHAWLEAARRTRFTVAPTDQSRLLESIAAILDGYLHGTRHGIRADADGLLCCGEPGYQLTWMDAKVGDWVVTPRAGKPVEVQALWINALWVGATLTSRWQHTFERARQAFSDRFWNSDRQCLYDVVDVDHQRGHHDATVRPNQVLALGGLPLPLIVGERARLMLEVIEDTLLTPLGLRSLAPGEPGYAPRYQGGVAERDRAYHNGTVWPWLLGPFVEAWLRVHGATPANRRRARERFLPPLRAHLAEAGLGHVSEIADAEAPHTPRGCPWQAWSLGELLRLELDVLGPTPQASPSTRRSRSRPSSLSVTR